jgi:superfamily II DNA or RNA helicase
LHRRGGDFITSEAEALMNHRTITGCAITEYERHANQMPAMAFCVSVDHAHAVAKQFQESGHAALALDGGTAMDIRRSVVADFRSGALRILTSCDLFSEGFDLPGVHAGILLRPTDSLGLYLQQVGRILRVAPGKAHAIILDHVNNTLRHGLPTESQGWALTDTDKKKGAPPVKVCPKCYCAMPSAARQCPECGFIFESEERERSVAWQDGDLEELTPEALAKRRARIEQGRAQSLDELIQIGKERGYKPGWAFKVHAARQARRGSKTPAMQAELDQESQEQP